MINYYAEVGKQGNYQGGTLSAARNDYFQAHQAKGGLTLWMVIFGVCRNGCPQSVNPMFEGCDGIVCAFHRPWKIGSPQQF